MAFAIVIMGFLIGALLAQPAMDASIDDLKDARIETSDQMIEIANTDFTIESAGYNSTTGVLNMTIKNRGADVLQRSSVNVMVDGRMTDSSFGPGPYIYPTQTAMATVTNVTDPGSVMIVGPWGISRVADDIQRT